MIEKFARYLPASTGEFLDHHTSVDADIVVRQGAFVHSPGTTAPEPP
jgi:hypothetical protein